MASRKLVGIATGAMLGMGMVGCQAIAPIHLEAVSSIGAVRGRVVFPIRTTQATLGEVANAATVSLIDASTGNTVSSSLTDASGSFVLTFNNFTPVAGTPYVLEAVKGLSAGGTANRVGASAARLRTLLFWNNGWQSLTNSTPGTGIVVSAATTAIATISSLKQLSVPTMLQLVNSVSGSSFTDGKGGLSSASDFQPVLTLVSNAMALDQDPVGQIAYDASSGAYSLPTGVPAVASITPTIPTPGQTLTVHGSYFDPNPGRMSFWFGAVSASTYSVSVDRTSVTVTIPGSAVSAPFTMVQPNGVVQTLSPFLFLHGTVGTVAGNGSPAFADGVRFGAEFNSPGGITVDPLGNLYVSDFYNNRLRLVSPGGVVTTLAGSSAVGATDGVGTSATFNGPGQHVADNQGNLYIADWKGNRIRKMVLATGAVTTIAGNGVAGFQDGTGTNAEFNQPAGMTLDGNGHLYIADEANNRIRILTLSSGAVTTLAGSTQGYLDGTGTSALFYWPEGIVYDGNGNLIVTDRYNNLIRKIVISSAAVTTLAGSTTPGYADGAGTAARFNSEDGIAMDASGNFYVADDSNERVRKVTPAGVVTTVAGSGVAGYQDGATSSANFNNPECVAVDTSGNIFVTDWTDHHVRVITP